MSEPTPTTAHGWRPSRRTGLAAGAAAVLVVAVAVGLGTGDRGEPDAVTSAGATPSATAGPRTPAAPAPSATAGDDAAPDSDAAGTPTAEPTTQGPPAADAGAPGPAGAPAPTAVPELPPVPLTDPAEFGTQVAARLAGVVRVDGQGQGLGEDSGPALAVTVEMDNGTAEPLDLSFVAVTLLDDAGNPGQVLLGDPRSAPFSGPLAPGGTAVATYVLRLPDPGTAGVTVTVSYGAEAPTAVFTGPVPAAEG